MAANVQRLVIRGTYLGQVVESVFGFMPSVTPTADPLNVNFSLQEAIRTSPTPVDSFLALYLGCMVTDYTFESTTVVTQTWLSNLTPWRTVYVTPPAATIVEQAPPGLPPQVCVVLKRRAPFAARHALGRTFMPAVPAGGVTNGQVNATGAYRSALDLFLARSLSFITGSFQGGPITSFRPVLIRRGPADADGGPRVTQVTTGEIASITRAQRRRIIGVGI